MKTSSIGPAASTAPRRSSIACVNPSGTSSTWCVTRTIIGAFGFCGLVLGWSLHAAEIGGVALSTTSVAVVYAVMIEFGLNRTEYGKTVLAACFINDLGTVLALGFIFAPFTTRTLIFALACLVAFAILPWLTPRFFRLYGNRPSELETKFLLLCLLGMGALAGWADSEAVLPAYIIGMVLAGTVAFWLTVIGVPPFGGAMVAVTVAVWAAAV